MKHENITLTRLTAVAFLLLTQGLLAQVELDPITFHGRFTDEVTGHPVSGVGIVPVIGPIDEPWTIYADGARSDEEGRWRVTIPVDLTQPPTLHLCFVSPTHGAIALRMKRWPDLETYDVGTVQLRRGSIFQARVRSVDALQWPIKRPRLVCHAPDGQAISDNRAWHHDLLPLAPPGDVVDENGRLSTRWALHPGQWRLETTSHAVLEPEGFRIGASPSPGERMIRITRGVRRTISGMVRDELHRPIPGALITVSQREGAHSKITLTTRSIFDGSFRFDRRFAPNVDPGPWTWNATSPDRKLVRSSHFLPTTRWNAGPLNVVLQGKISLEVRVRHATTDEPVEIFEVRSGPWWPSRRGAALTERSIGEVGRAVIPRSSLRAGLVVQVVPRSRGGELAPSRLRFVYPEEKVRELTFHIRETRHREVELRDHEGGPIGGARVQVLATTDEHEDYNGHTQWHPSQPFPPGGILSETLVSDEKGCIRIRGASDARFELRIEHDEMVRQIVPNLEMGVDLQTHIVRLQRAASVEVTVTSPAWLKRIDRIAAGQRRRGVDPELRSGLALRVATESTTVSLSAPEVPLARTGGDAFALRGIPPGRWQLTWQFCGDPEDPRPIPTVLPLGEPFPLEAGGAARQTLDLSDHLPADFRVRAVLGDEFLALRDISLAGWGKAPAGRGLHRYWHGQADDHATLTGSILPGLYRLQVNVEPFPWHLTGDRVRVPVMTTLPTPLRMEPGQRFEATVEARICRRPIIRLIREGDGSRIEHASLLRRFDDDDPGDWIGPWIDPFRPGPGLKPRIGTHALAAGRHRIYLPAREAFDRYSKTRSKRSTLWSTLFESPLEPPTEGLHFLGTIDVSRDDQIFEFLVPDHLGW